MKLILLFCLRKQNYYSPAFDHNGDKKTKTCETVTIVSLGGANNASKAVSFKNSKLFFLKKRKISQLKLSWNVALLEICITAAGANHQYSQCKCILKMVTVQWPTHPPTSCWSFQKSWTEKLQELQITHPKEGLNQTLTSTVHYYTAGQRKISIFVRK